MAAAKRVLFLGITGIDKNAALTRLNALLENQSGGKGHVIDFEREHLWPTTPSEPSPVRRRSFLDSDLRLQWEWWQESWQAFVQHTLSSIPSSAPVFLAMHGCFLRGHYGVRCVFDPGLVARQFKPDLVITLVDDIYEMWWRTEQRAQQQSGKKDEHSLIGRPSLEQLVIARRQEIMIGDIIAHASDAKPKNMMLSINHPTRTFANCVIAPHSDKVAYLSFPISQPRKMEASGDKSARNAVSAFVKAAFREQSEDGHLIVECPLTIDELPLTKMLSMEELASRAEQEGSSKNSSQVIEFDRDKLRWTLDELWPANGRLGSQTPARSPFPASLLLNAMGNIDTDVTFRDYRLVDQADYLVVFNPIMAPDRTTMARSVRQEIDYALSQEKKCYVYQDPKLDPKFIVWNSLGLNPPNEVDGGAQMAPPPRRALVTMVDSVDELIRKMVEHI